MMGTGSGHFERRRSSWRRLRPWQSGAPGAEDWDRRRARLQVRMNAVTPPFRHLLRLTDRVGLLHQAEGVVPRVEHGYCVDDNARGLLVVCREPSPRDELITLARRYLYFLTLAQGPDAVGARHRRRPRPDGGHPRRGARPVRLGRPGPLAVAAPDGVRGSRRG